MDEVFRHAHIVSGALQPRQRLPSIAGLVREYGIARTTAAKALKVLVDEGLAEVVADWGTYVTPRDLSAPHVSHPPGGYTRHSPVNTWPHLS